MEQIYDLGSRRELFVDDFFIRELNGAVSRRLHQPVPAEIVFTADAPHEMSNHSGGSYCSIVHDEKENRYLMYYRAGMRTPTPGNPSQSSDFILCVAETRDGIHFERCRVDLLPTGGNVVLDSSMTRHLVPERCKDTCPGVTSVFYDTNPDCPDDERFKMIVTNEQPHLHPDEGMYLFVSADGYRFRQKTKKFKLDPQSGYDSINQAFYDPVAKQYRLFHRGYGKRDKRTVISHMTKDFVTFTNGAYLEFDEEFQRCAILGQELYTNGIRPYFRAPHILLGFPMRYFDGAMIPGCYAGKGDWNCSVLSRPDFNNRLFRANMTPRYGLCSTDSVLIASRDGVHFQGWTDAFLTPPPTEDSWFYGSASLAIGMIPTASRLGYGAPDELSFYSPEGSWGDGCTRFRRNVLRTDGFVSLHFESKGGVLLTPPFRFKGGRLTLNIVTGAVGGFRAEFRDSNGKPIPGYTFEECYEERGDSLEMTARWKTAGPDVRPLEGETVQLAILARNCDLYSICFAPWQPDPEVPPLN